MSDPTQCSVYRLRLVLNGVSPLVWRGSGGGPAPDENDGGAWGYQQLQDHYKFPPLEAMSLLAETTQSALKNGSRAEIDLEELEDATGRVEAYLTFRDRKFDRRELNAGL